MKWFLLVCFFVPTMVIASSETVHINALVSGCGNGVVETGEACDGNNLSGQSCSLFGFAGGTLHCSANCTFVTASCLVPDSGGNNGSEQVSKPNKITANTVTLEGMTIPKVVVWLLRDGKRISSVTSDDQGAFHFSIPAFTPGTYTMSMYAETGDNLRTNAFSFPFTNLAKGVSKFETFFIGPTINTEQLIAQKGQNFNVRGQTVPDSEVIVVVYQAGQALFQVTTNSDVAGAYLESIPTDTMASGDYTVIAYAMKDGKISAPSRTLNISVGGFSVLRSRDFAGCPFGRGDVNYDCRVDIQDIQLTRAWWRGRIDLPDERELERLSGDSRISAKDFSIILYNWTG